MNIIEKADAAHALTPALTEFLKWAMREGPWIGADLDGGDIQAKAISLRLIVKEPYHPAKHGDAAAHDCADPEPGQDWYVFAPGLA